jgi:hypothetical protein
MEQRLVPEPELALELVVPEVGLKIRTCYAPPKMVVPVCSGTNNPCGPVTMVDLSPALARNCFSASVLARRTAGSALVGAGAGGGGNGAS